MIWMDIVALSCGLITLLFSKAFYARLLGGMLITHYIAAIISEYGGGNIQAIVRFFSFMVVFLGTGLSVLMLFVQSSRREESIEE